MMKLIAIFSLGPEEMVTVVIETKRAWQALGQVHYGQTEKESKSAIFRRSITACKDIMEGEAFNESNTRIIRPGDRAP